MFIWDNLKILLRRSIIVLEEHPDGLNYHMDFDTTLQRYKKVMPSVQVLQADLNYQLLFNEHVLVLDNQLIDSKFYRENFSKAHFQSLITQGYVTDIPSIVVGMRSNCQTLDAVLENMAKYNWWSSSMENTNSFFATNPDFKANEILKKLEI